MPGQPYVHVMQQGGAQLRSYAEFVETCAGPSLASASPRLCVRENGLPDLPVDAQDFGLVEPGDAIAVFFDDKLSAAVIPPVLQTSTSTGAARTAAVASAVALPVARAQVLPVAKPDLRQQVREKRTEIGIEANDAWVDEALLRTSTVHAAVLWLMENPEPTAEAQARQQHLLLYVVNGFNGLTA